MGSRSTSPSTGTSSSFGAIRSGDTSWPRTSCKADWGWNPSCSPRMRLRGSRPASRSRGSLGPPTALETASPIPQASRKAMRRSLDGRARSWSSAARASRFGPRAGGERGAGGKAGGRWAGLLASTVGVELPLEPIPRHVLVTGGFPGAPERRTLVIDAESSFYFHREGAGVLMGMGDPNERASFAPPPAETFVAGSLLPPALRVFPPLEAASVEHSWVGLYEMTPDRHPILGQAPGLQGFYLANGFSGHGFQHAPVGGRLLAEMIVEAGARTVDVSSLGLERFARGELVPEGHVV